MDLNKLKEIVAGTDAGTPVYVGQVAGQPMLAHVPPLIEVNLEVKNPADGSEVICRSTQAAKDYLAAHAGDATKSTGNYQIMTGIALPELKRRGNTSGSGAPTKYPFADLPVGGVFFSGNSEHNKGDAVKALGSTVSAQNDKYSKTKVENGQEVFKSVTRAVRDKVTKKAKFDAEGKKVMETVQLPVKEYERKFTIRPVPAGYQSGDWVAPEAGALVARTK